MAYKTSSIPSIILMKNKTSPFIIKRNNPLSSHTIIDFVVPAAATHIYHFHHGATYCSRWSASSCLSRC